MVQLIASAIAGLLTLFGGVAFGATISQPVQGGTGSSTLTGILVGNGTSPVQSAIIGTGLSLVGKTLSSTGSASSTLLSDNNSFSGANSFSQTITGAVTGNAGTATLLQNARTINGVSFNGGADIVLNAASSSILSDNNTFSGSNTFSATTTLSTALQFGATARDALAYFNCGLRIWPSSVTSGGCLSVSGGTTNTGAEVVIDDSGASTGRMLVLSRRGSTATGEALFASSTATGASTIGVIGAPTNKGIVKITHSGSGTGFSNAAALSIDLLKCTDCQGIFIDRTGGAGTGNLLTLRDGGSDELNLTPLGLLTVPSASTTNLTSSALYFANGGLLANAASSTITNLTVINSTTTNATSTNFSTTNASTTNFTISGLKNALLSTDINGKVAATTTLGETYLQTSGVTAGSCTNCSITVNDRGFVTAQSSGSAGAGADPFTHPAANTSATTSAFLITASTTLGNGTQANGLTIFGGATTTLLHIFQAGYLSLASSTVGGGAQASGLTIFGGATTTKDLTVQGSATTSNLSVTVSASTTKLTISNAISALLLTDASGVVGKYGGATSCGTNQFFSGLSAVGASTCSGTALDPFTHPSAGVSATSSGFLITASTTIGAGATGTGLTILGGATTTLLHLFQSGLVSQASSTVGAGAQATGLTIFGGATTTLLSLMQNGYISQASSTVAAQFNANSIAIASSTPWGIFGLISNLAQIFTAATTTGAKPVFGFNNAGGIQISASRPATSTTITLDWNATPPQIEYNIGTAATTINIINATSSLQWGSRKLVWVCNPASTAGALTWGGVEWIGTAPTQTTTANQCDVYSFDITAATSSFSAAAYKVAGSGGTGFQ